jgi:ABC-type phosphate transport system substrate-binding protein
MEGHIVLNKWLIRLGVVALAGISVASMGFSGSAGAAGAKPLSFLGSGSDASYKPTAALDTLYNQSPGCRTIIQPPETVQPTDFSCLPDNPGQIHSENYAHNIVREAYPLGASVGIQQVCGNLSGVGFARNVRAAKSTDCTGLHFVSFARDGLAWECFGTCHNVTNLTKTQLQGIYGDCSIHNWNQVGGTNAPIVVYSVNPGAGVKSNWNSYLGISDDTHCSPDANHVIHQNENQEILASDKANAIFYFSIASWNVNVKPHPDGSTLGKLEGVAPTRATVSSGVYPLGFNEGFVYCNASTGASPCPAPANATVKSYIGEGGWICKASAAGDHKASHSIDPLTGVNYRTEIETTLTKFGLVPITYGPTGGSATGSSFCREVDH